MPLDKGNTMKQITIVGIGMGNEKTLTIEAAEAIKNAEVLIGAKRMIGERAADGQQCAYVYLPNEVKAAVEGSTCERFAILMSGDTGFYSATKQLRDVLDEYEVKVLPGISSVSYFSSKIGLSWDDCYLLSRHGREGDLVGAVRTHEKTFSLTANNVPQLCKELVEVGLDEVTVYIGERLSYEDEAIHTGKPSEFVDQTFASVSVIMVVNPNWNNTLRIGIDDEEFIRAKVPMTKSEVRAVIMSKLQIKPGTVVYDIGAGTGSVSIEMALNNPNGMVYAVEHKEAAVELIGQNKEKFQVGNLEIIHGAAPEAMEGLPEPSSVFIGGSSGNMEQILANICKASGRVRIVASAIALETLSEVISLYDKFGLQEVDIAQVSVAKAKKVARYNMMMGQNPIYIISGTKETSYEKSRLN